MSDFNASKHGEETGQVTLDQITGEDSNRATLPEPMRVAIEKMKKLNVEPQPHLDRTRERIALRLLWILSVALAVHYIGQWIVFRQDSCKPIIDTMSGNQTVEAINAIKNLLDSCMQIRRDNQAGFEKIFTTWFGAIIAIIGSAIAFFYSKSEKS